MKKILQLLFLGITIFACTKSSMNQEAKSADSDFSIKVNVNKNDTIKDTIKVPSNYDYEIPTRIGDSIIIISPHGTDLMSDKSVNSKKLVKISYREKVIINESMRNLPYDTIIDSITNKKLSGAWVKVKYKDKVGYILDSYTLYPSELPKDTLDWHLLFENSHCDINYYYNPSYNYYGVFNTDSGQYLKKVKFNFFIDRSQELTGITIATNEKNKPLFMVGTKNNLKVTFLKIIPTTDTIATKINQNNNTEITIPEIRHTHIGDYNGKHFNKFTVKQDKVSVDYKIFNSGRTEIIFERFNKKPSQIQKEIRYDGECENLQMYWCGDIDQDGKMDYLINCPGKAGYKNLYISSGAPRNNIVKLVAINFFGWCC